MSDTEKERSMSGMFWEGIRQLAHYRVAIAVGVPVVGVAVATAGSVLTPRGMAKGLITGAYMLLASLGAACLLVAMIALFKGEPRPVFVSLFIPGIALTVIMGMFTPVVIREYQQFEFRKLAAEIFRRS
jgi:hypothetical protein